MSTVLAACCCDTLSSTVVRCEEHHRYFRDGKELTSVTKVLKSTWPVKPDFSRADPAVIENARDRGKEVDALFSSYVNGTLWIVPMGTRRDSWELLDRLIKWWDRLGVKAQAQVILADDEVAGTCDIKPPSIIWDLKCTYNIEATYPVQLGMYAILDSHATGKLPGELGIIHCTERFKEPKLIDVPMSDAMHDAEIVRQMYRLVSRRGGWKA